MRFQVIERTRKWRPVDNHLDARHCPICAATVHGNHGQAGHLQWHVNLAAQLDHAPGHADDDGTEPWTAAVDEGASEQEEADNAAQ